MILGNLFQIAYVTRDLEKAMAEFREQADVRLEYTHEGEVEVVTPTGPRSMSIKIGFMWVGDIQYELIQPISGMEDIYDPFYSDDGSLRVHHVCMRIHDWDAFLVSVERQGYPIAFQGDLGAHKFLYLDARKTLGHYLEYSIWPDEMWAAAGGR